MSSNRKMKSPCTAKGVQFSCAGWLYGLRADFYQSITSTFVKRKNDSVRKVLLQLPAAVLEVCGPSGILEGKLDQGAEKAMNRICPPDRILRIGYACHQWLGQPPKECCTHPDLTVLLHWNDDDDDDNDDDDDDECIGELSQHRFMACELPFFAQLYTI